MDRRIWRRLVSATGGIDWALDKPKKKFVFCDQLIVLMLLWAALHDRPMAWACDRTSYNSLFRPRRLPSKSQFSRRLRTPRFRRLLKILHRRLTRNEHMNMVVAYLDGKALPVGDCTKDPDAKIGRGSGRFSRGYKLHALVDDSGKICDYRVRSLNEQEQPVAMRLVCSVRAGSLVLADGNYDSGSLYERLRRRGSQLLTRLRQVPRSAQAIEAMPPGRRAAFEAWTMNPLGCAEIYKRRHTVERTFAHLTGFSGGLAPLPTWVRGLQRVERWVSAKIAIYHARIDAKLGRS